MVKITSTSNLSEYEKKKAQHEEDQLIVGKEDRTLSVLSLGHLIPLLQPGTEEEQEGPAPQLADFTRTGSLNGVLKIPALDGTNFIVQYGVNSLDADSTRRIDFHESFPIRVFQVIPTLRAGEGGIAMRLPTSDSSGFDLEVSGGTSSTNSFYWLAIGF